MNLSEFVQNSPKYKDIDIVKKYYKHAEFKKQLLKIEKQYDHKLNMSLYMSLQHLEKLKIIQIFNIKNNKQQKKDTFFLNFYGYKMQFSQLEDEQKFYLLFIRMLDQKLRSNPLQNYSIIYYHCLSQSINPFSFLNQTFKKLPIFYYAMLEKIYVVQANFIIKNTIGIFDFGRLHKLYTRRVQYIDNLYELSKIPEINKSNVLETIPQVLKQQRILKQQKKIAKGQALQNIQNKTHKREQKFLENINIMKLADKQDFFSIPLQNHNLNSQGLPVPFLILIETFKSHPQFLDLQGIFRKNGSIQEQQQIIKELQKMPNVAPLKNISQYSGYAIAGVAKKFFNKLVIPIVPYEIYNQIMIAHSIQPGKQVDFVRSIFYKLPNLNKKILMYLIFFLKEQVISRKQQNKMNNYNMSVCFCPCIFRSKQITFQDLMNTLKYVKILDILFSKFQQIFAKQEVKFASTGKQNRSSKGSKSSRGSRNSKQNKIQSIQDSPTKRML